MAKREDRPTPAATPAPTPPTAALAISAQLAAFESLLNVQITLYDFAEFFRLGGHRIFPDHHGAHDRCGFCKFVKDDLGRLRACLHDDMAPMVVRAENPAQWRRCHAGVWEVVAPLWDGLQFIGAMNVGCFRKPGESPVLSVESETHARSAGPAGALRQHHRALRELDPATEDHLPTLVQTFATGLVRHVSRLHAASQAGGAGSPPGQAAAPAQDSRRRRNRAIELFFRTHLTPQAQLADLAAYLHLSTARTSQILRQELNTTFPALIRKTRLSEACRLLTVSELPIGKIAELAGFADRNYFCRVFTKELQTTPSEYRKQHARTLRA